MFTHLTQPVLTKPEKPVGPNAVEQTIFIEEFRQYLKNKKSLDATLASLYSVIWGQCSKLMQNKLKARTNYTDFDDECDVGVLLTNIKSLSNTIEENTSRYDVLYKAKFKFY